VAKVAGSPDVIIIGASLAGAAAAFRLARGGASVFVLEKSHFPRPKICGEFLSAESFPVLSGMGLLGELREHGAEEISTFAAYGPSGSPVTGRMPKPVLSISRDLLDNLVIGKSREAGARIHFDETVVSWEGNSTDGFTVRTTKSMFNAPTLIGAWGRFSTLDPRLKSTRHGGSPALFGFKKHLTGESGFLSGKVVLHVFDRGYLGLSRVEKGIVNLAALTVPEVAREAHHDFDRLLRRLCRESRTLGDHLSGLSAVPGPVLVSEPVHLGPRGPLVGEALLAGDAAGVLDPYTGSGMSAALISGDVAGELVLRHLEGAMDAAELRHTYQEKYDRLMKGRFFFSRLFRPVFVSRFAARLLHPLASPIARVAVRLTRI
jgi:flavin-dependent dehydrogenase